MKNYLWGVCLVLFVCFMLGAILPALFSAKSHEAFVLFVVLAVAFPVVVFWTFKKLTKLGIKK